MAGVRGKIVCQNPPLRVGPTSDPTYTGCWAYNSRYDEFCHRCKQRLWTDCTKCGEANEHRSEVCLLCGELTEYAAEVKAEEMQRVEAARHHEEQKQKVLDDVATRREEARRNNPAIAAATEAYEADSKKEDKALRRGCQIGCLAIFGLVLLAIFGSCFG